MLLRDKDRQTLLAIFASAKTPIEIWAHGSRVSGEAHDGSDLDLVLRTKDLQKMPIDEFLELKEKIQESNIPILVELFDWCRLPEAFHPNIEAKHEVLFSNMDLRVNEPPSEYGKKGANS
jgi:predicted nucleotidyltransferase